MVLLCARTGWGKSTTSAWLGRTGWELLDDDNSAVELVGDQLRIVPMGARARLREDAASGLGARGETLAGYAGGKQALDAGDPTVRRTLGATVHLVQLPNDADAPALEVAPVAATAALVSLSRSMQVVDRTDAAARDRRVRMAQRLAQAPAFSVTYRRDAVAPRAVADAIVDAVGSLEQNLEDSARLPPPCGVLQVDA